MYKLTNSAIVIRLADSAFIPADPANTDYAQYLQWLSEGNTPEPADKPTQAQLVATTLAKARSMRLPIMQVLDGMQASALVNSDLSLAQSIETAKQSLRNLPQTVDLTPFTTARQMEMAVLAAYQSIVVAAPASIKSAFDSLKP